MYEELKYSEQHIALVRAAIENSIKSREDFSYTVKIDGLAIVSRSRDLSLFDSFRDHVNDETKKVAFICYYGDKSGDTFTLLVNGYTSPAKEKRQEIQNTQALAGLDKEEIRRYAKLESDNEYLTRENERLKEELARKEKFVKEVDVFIAQLRVQQNKVKDKGTLEYIGNFVSTLVTKFPDLLGNGSVLESLAGLLPKSQDKQPETLEGPKEEVTIKPKSEIKEDPETAELLKVLRTLKKYYSEIEFQQCLALVYLIKDHKELIVPVKEWLQEQIKSKQEIAAMLKRAKEMRDKRQRAQEEEAEKEEEVQPTTEQPAEQENEKQTGEDEPLEDDSDDSPITYQ
ncbi:MAG: hypothetical protein AB1458_12045 [Bacteroidota bacterium]